MKQPKYVPHNLVIFENFGIGVSFKLKGHAYILGYVKKSLKNQNNTNSFFKFNVV